MFRRSFRSALRGTLLAALVAGILVASGITAPLDRANALTKTSELSPADRAKSFAYFKGLEHCLALGWFKNSTFNAGAQKNNDMAAADAGALTWFSQNAATGTPVGNLYPPPPLSVILENAATVGVINEAEDGDVNCANADWIRSALGLWGYTSGVQFLCDLGFTREVNPNSCTEIVDGATNNFRAPDNPAGKLATFWTSELGGSSTGVESIGAGEYRLLLDSFMGSCAVSPGGSDYTIQQFADGAKTPSPAQYSVASRDRGLDYQVRLWQASTQFCKQIAEQIDEVGDRAVKAYKAWLDAGGTGDNPKLGLCDKDPTAPGCEPETTSCNIPQLGWILCPVLTTGAAIADSAYGFLADSFLQTDISLLNTNPDAQTDAGQKIGTGTYTAWKIMQGLANVAFVIAVLIIIFSQLTSIGISNYGVKKLLPRVIIAAILVNLSFFVCQLAVDLSNVLGSSLKGALEGVADQVTASGGGTAASTADESTNLAGIVTLVITGLAVAWINIGALLIGIIGAVISLLTIFVLLVARKVLIVLLIVIAPLAFVAYLLPNTEPLFHKWRKLLTSLLLLFPIIGLLYGASLLASAIMLQVAGDDIILRLAAYLALVLPLLAVIPLLKGSLDGIGKIGGAIQAFGSKAQGAAQKGTQKAYDNSRLGQFKKFREGVGQRRRAQIQGGTYRGKGGVLNPRNWGSALSRNVLNPASGQFGRELSASAAELVDQEVEREVKSAGALMTQQRLTSDELQELAHGREVRRAGQVIMRAPNEAMQQAAVREKLRTGTTGEVEQLLIGSAATTARIRQELARGIHANGHVAKTDYLGGDFADRVLRGEIAAASDLDDAAARRLNAGKLSAETIVAQDADALERFARVSGDASAGTRTDIGAAQLDSLRDQAIEAMTNDQYRAKITGQKAAPIDLISRL